MKNIEKYKDKLLEIYKKDNLHLHPAIVDGVPRICSFDNNFSPCESCRLREENGKCSSTEYLLWLHEQYDPKMLDREEKDFLQILINKMEPAITHIMIDNENGVDERVRFCSVGDGNAKNKYGDLLPFEPGAMYKKLSRDIWYDIKVLGLKPHQEHKKR